ncbi:AAA family ATPase [Microcoleus sp. T3B2]|uniref:AAA family ATPase n=1 Tax=Microcoleus sp. T3B2 TaxID=3055426 RepID=UPI002FD63A97
MRIIKVEIKNFRAFYNHHIVELAKVGERGKPNLLIYGENGSGKSSLLLALQYLLESGINNLDFEQYKNIFAPETDEGYIKFFLRQNLNTPQIVHEWSSTTRTTNDPDIIAASQAKGILDYKRLLEVHFIHHKEPEVNIFELLVHSLLGQCINDLHPLQKTFPDNWRDLLAIVPKQKNHKRKIAIFEAESQIFNQGLRAKLNELEQKATQLMEYFGYKIVISLHFQGITFDNTAKYRDDQKENCIDNRKILLNIKFLDREISSPHHFLNEAKLSAIAIALYFSSLLVAPKPQLKLLALDDIFIGLDMSNRLPLIDIIKDQFREYQIFLMTYDREWYEILKQRFDGNKWVFQELYCGKITDDLEIPVWKQDTDYLDKAQQYLTPIPPQAPDLKASAVYLRTAFEVILKKFCDKHYLKVKYQEESKKLTTDDFWQPIIAYKKQDNTEFVSLTCKQNIELYRSLIMNPLNHARITQTYDREIQEAIDAVKTLKHELGI